MPETRDIPLARWGEDLRRTRGSRRRGRLRLAAAVAAAMASTAAVATLLWPPRPALVWNASASSPVGLYAVDPGAIPAAGDMVIAWPPRAAQALAQERGYLPANVPLVKRVAGAAGDRVCAVGETVFVNGRVAAQRRSLDGAGRALPTWTGCIDLADGQLFLLMPGSSASFDGRYFGATERRDVIGKAALLWPG